MGYLYLMAHLTGGSKPGLFAVQVVLCVLFYGGFRRIIGQRAYATGFAYLWTGFLTLGLPLSIALPGTTWVGIMYLTVLWPFWLYGPLVGLNIENHIPTWLATRMFA